MDAISGGLTGLGASALTAIGLYIKSRITKADKADEEGAQKREDERELRIKQLEEKDQSHFEELKKKVDQLTAELGMLRSHILLLEGFRTAVTMLASSGATVHIAPETILRLSQELDMKLKELNKENA